VSDNQTDDGKQSSGISISVQYQATNDRRSKNFEFFWQAVALSLTAQAFLMLIALGGSTSSSGRILAASLSFLVSLASLSLMKSQRSYQKIEALWLDYFEQGGESTHLVHEGNREERLDAVRGAYEKAGIGFTEPSTNQWSWRTLVDFPSDATRMWTVLMWSFVVVDFIVLGIVIFSHSSLN
jgi:hypothetical protein